MVCVLAEFNKLTILGAGEGNRTLVLSLEGFSSTIKLHPQVACALY